MKRPASASTSPQSPQSAATTASAPARTTSNTPPTSPSYIIPVKERTHLEKLTDIRNIYAQKWISAKISLEVAKDELANLESQFNEALELAKLFEKYTNPVVNMDVSWHERISHLRGKTHQIGEILDYYSELLQHVDKEIQMEKDRSIMELHQSALEEISRYSDSSDDEFDPELHNILNMLEK